MLFIETLVPNMVLNELKIQHYTGNFRFKLCKRNENLHKYNIDIWLIQIYNLNISKIIIGTENNYG